MAPDKIFLVTPSCASEQDKPFWSEEEWQGAISVEYIRKDALLEWAKKKNKRIDTEDGDYSLGYVSAMIDLIEKIESL